MLLHAKFPYCFITVNLFHIKFTFLTQSLLCSYNDIENRIIRGKDYVHSVSHGHTVHYSLTLCLYS